MLAMGKVMGASKWVWPSKTTSKKIKRKTRQAAKNSPHQIRKRSHFGTGHRKTPPPQKQEKYSR
jgi:hypothetical protein